MAHDESFRPRYYIDEREAYELIGSPRIYREIVSNKFDGPVAEWANYRTALFDDSISPVMTFPEQLGNDVHRVSWVSHSGKDPETGVPYSQHHVVCDCSLMAELAGEPGAIFDCSILQKTLARRAAYWRNELKLDKILRACIDSEDGRKNTTLDRQLFETETVKWLLTHDNEHPEDWFGNIVSGEHMVSLIALILQEPPEKVHQIAGNLAEDGYLEYDGQEVIRLAA